VCGFPDNVMYIPMPAGSTLYATCRVLTRAVMHNLDKITGTIPECD
jgi:hypothetical protein